jgi:hypothetical protein
LRILTTRPSRERQGLKTRIPVHLPDEQVTGVVTFSMIEVVKSSVDEHGSAFSNLLRSSRIVSISSSAPTRLLHQGRRALEQRYVLSTCSRERGRRLALIEVRREHPRHTRTANGAEHTGSHQGGVDSTLTYGGHEGPNGRLHLLKAIG